jgi:DNA-binding MarR family transcriptional regulator
MTTPPDLLMLLNDVARLTRVAADKRARLHGMTRAQWVMLLRLERQPGLSQKEVAEILEVEPITVARLIDRLEQRGLVERRADGRDRRIWRLHLRPAAMPLLREIEQERAALQVMVSQGIDEAALGAMTKALVRMRSTLCSEVRRRPEAVDRELPEPKVA